jgi:hypothetical protein
MGMAGAEDIRSVFASCAKVITEILDLRPDFWGPHAPVVDSFLNDLATELRQRVELKLAAARSEFTSRFGSETEEVRSILIQQIELARSCRRFPKLPRGDQRNSSVDGPVSCLKRDYSLTLVTPFRSPSVRARWECIR